MEDNKRVKVVISGRVQGVFFRYETQKTAIKNNVLGWVRNKSNGDVEAVFEGKKDNVESVIKWCYTGSPSSNVTNVDIKDEKYTGEFKDFKITG